MMQASPRTGDVVIRVLFYLLTALVVCSCSSRSVELELELREAVDGYHVSLINNTGRPVRILGGAQLGNPPGIETIQWHVESSRGVAFPCMHVENFPDRFLVNPGESLSMSVDKLFLERFFCLPKGRYEVRAYYAGSEDFVYSNVVRSMAADY